MPTVYVGMGSNVDPQRHVARALEALERTFGSLQVSSVYQTPAVGFEGDDFLNLVVAFRTRLPVSAVVERLRQIEAQHGRHRGDGRYAPRTLDLDLLLYGDLIAHHDGISVPRDEIEHHAFVLCPLAELAGERRHPRLGRTFTELWDEMRDGAQPLRRVEIASAQPARGGAEDGGLSY